ncbi:hypothetical protein K437DRAFT_42449 [Tilletiaria anomala UBC 951]|uniref:Uncharacterized protein n=1 Tax=Tilletiaria anomala (strain ATCC 24038 / CBS 436.72 / UBC 951) TaxID=1037660 RepID=A0A066VAC8_TILAU|nr:uncharacterized protein K437DRAFT_42449 [Tilletiaria anomala UBC 951]KDN37243.1 hypothetical protein K437DRAFT_42449 [Tilletiaria anomala UBC 951]
MSYNAGAGDSSAPTWSDNGPYQSTLPTGPANPEPGTRKEITRIVGSRAASQLTEKEAEALSRLKKTASNFKFAGYILGTLGTTFFMRRRKPDIKHFSLLAYSTAGGLGAAFLLEDLGVIAGQRYLKDVEDPQHLAMVLKEARADRIQRQQGTGPPPPLQATQDGVRQLPASIFNPYDSSEVSRDQPYVGNGSWSANSAPLDASNPSTSDAYFEGREAGWQSRTQSPPPSQPQQDQLPPSRWAQLRGERGAQVSRWDELRQQNARDGLSQTPRLLPGQGPVQQPQSQWQSPGQGQGDFASTAANVNPRSGAILADPTFGKGTQEDRARASREFEASMERERRGMDSAGDSWAR